LDKKDSKIVYIAMSADLFHQGHLNIIKEAKKLGRVVVGLLTDEAIASYKRLPFISFNERKLIVENIKGIDEVIPQTTLDYVPNLKKLKPDFVVHGDDWKTGIQKEVRQRVIDTLNIWGGKLIETKYVQGISSTALIKAVKAQGTTPEKRMRTLKQLILAKPLVKFLEAHNGLSGLIVEKINIQKDEKKVEFDGIWLGGLTISASKGKPDSEVVDFSTKFQIIEEIIEVTTKPIIVDGDTGGQIEHFRSKVRSLERLGASAVIIEDKIGLKWHPSSYSNGPKEQEIIENFCEKIRAGNQSLVTDDFMIIARIESLLLKVGMMDALTRAKAYISAGADGIMIQSEEKNGNDIIKFCKEYKTFINRVPLVLVPSSFSHITEDEFKDLGVNIVIYENHLLRGAYPGMLKTAESILEYGCCKEASEKYCAPIKEILRLIPNV